MRQPHGWAEVFLCCGDDADHPPVPPPEPPLHHTEVLLDDALFEKADGVLVAGLARDDAALERLTLPRLTLARSDTGGWQVEPKSADRGADYAQATIDAWRHSRVLSLEPVDASRERIARVTLRYGDDHERRLDVIEREPELILRDAERGIDYHFAPHLATPLLDMQHPDTLGAGRVRSLQPSAIPLNPTGEKGDASRPD